MSPRDDDKTEYDVDEDDNVARSRAAKGDDGTYVGQTASDDSLDAGETGAEARGDKRGE